MHIVEQYILIYMSILTGSSSFRIKFQSKKQKLDK